MKKKLIPIILAVALIIIVLGSYLLLGEPNLDDKSSPPDATSSPITPTQPNQTSLEAPKRMREAELNQTIPAPSVPEFTVTFVNSSYDALDPYTGASQRVANNTVQITIKNQPFSTIYNPKGNMTTSLFYNLQVKGHYTDRWTEIYNSYNYSFPLSQNVYTWHDYPIQSNSKYTIISLPENYPVGKVDFRMQTIVANVTEIFIPNFIPNPIRIGGDSTPVTVMFILQTSGWSSTQTITIP